MCRFNEGSLMKVLQTLGAETTRAMFPNIKGSVEMCEILDNGVTIVRMAFNAWAVMVNGVMRACCPTRRHAFKFAKSFAPVDRAAYYALADAIDLTDDNVAF